MEPAQLGIRISDTLEYLIDRVSFKEDSLPYLDPYVNLSHSPRSVSFFIILISHPNLFMFIFFHPTFLIHLGIHSLP
jgi:hypothetical protein